MNKKNLILGGVLAVLLLLAYAYDGPFQKMKSENKKEHSFFSDLDVDKVNKIELNQEKTKKVFVRNGSEWQEEGVKNSLIDSQAIEAIISSLREVKESELVLVSEVAEKQKDFETAKDKGYNLVLKNGDEVLQDFVVGKKTADAKGSYVSEGTSAKTYTTAIDLNAVVARDDWYNKVIFASPESEIKKIRFQFPSREFTLEKQAGATPATPPDPADPKGAQPDSGTWAGTLPYKFPVDKNKIDQIVNIMSDLRATEIPAQSFKGTGLEKNSMIIEASGDNFSRVLMIGDANKDGLYYAKRGDSDNIYLITKEEKNQLEKRISDLK